MRNTRSIHRAGERGAAIVEFAIMFPVLVMMCMGAADFGRLFFHAVTVTQAAGTGVFYGAQGGFTSGRFSQMQQEAEDDADDLDRMGTVSATADRYCDCPDAPATGPADTNAVDCITGTCTTNGYGPPRVFVRTRVQQTFRTFGRYPGIPYGVDVGERAFLRVQ